MRAFIFQRPSILVLTLAAALATACGPPSSPSDAGQDASCRLSVEIAGSGDPFIPYVDGDEAEIVLGFQGFQMLPIDLRITGAPPGATHAEISASLAIAETGVEGGRVDRAAPSEDEPDGTLRVRSWLLFFNSAPVSQIAGRDGELEVIARVGGCAGGARIALRLIDEDQCVDFDASIPDASSLDGGVPDGAVACGATP